MTLIGLLLLAYDHLTGRIALTAPDANWWGLFAVCAVVDLLMVWVLPKVPRLPGVSPGPNGMEAPPWVPPRVP